MQDGLKAPILLDEGKLSEGYSTASKGMYWRLQHQVPHMQTDADMMG